MSEEQLLTITRNQSELKQPHKQVNKLERHREKLREFGDKTDKDLKCMFEKLNAGLCSERERSYMHMERVLWKKIFEC